MSKMRVYELAKTYEKSNSEIIDILTKHGVSVKSHMSSIDNDAIKLVENELDNKKQVKDVDVIEAINTYEKIKVPKGASVSDVATAAGEKSGNAVC